MTDRSDEFRDRLPEADRIRDRIREQREAGDDDLTDANDPEGYYQIALKDAVKSGASESKLDSADSKLAVHESELKTVVGESKLDSADVKLGEAGLKGVDVKLGEAGLKGVDVKLGEAGLKGVDADVKLGEAGLKGVDADVKLGDAPPGGTDQAAVFAKYDGFDGESQENVGGRDAPGRLGDDELVDDITVAPEQKITDDATVKGAGDLKGDGLKGVVDHRADDLKVAEGVDDPGFFEKPTWENVTDRSGDMKVVDHDANDLTSDVKVTVDGVIGGSGAPEVAISGDADWEVPLTNDDEFGVAAAPPTDNLEIEQTANLSGGEDPVGDALDPLGDGGDALVGLPDIELSDEGASGFADDIDLSDGI